MGRVGLVVALVLVAVVPSTALAAGETLSVAPSDTTAGGSPALTATLGFDAARAGGGTGAAVKTAAGAVIDLAPGLLLNLEANPACVTAAADFTSAACRIGSATAAVIVDKNGLGSGVVSTVVRGSLFLAAPAAGPGDLATIDVHLTSGDAAGSLDTPLNVPIRVAFESVTGRLTLRAGGFPATVSVAGQSLPLQVTGIEMSFDPTLEGRPFTRVPSTCGVAKSSLTVAYTDGSSGRASGAFTPAPCATVPFAPSLSATVSSDRAAVAQVKLDLTQGFGEAATKSISVGLPSDLAPDVVQLKPCLSGSMPCTLATATATTALGTFTGHATLSGTLQALAVQIVFGAPLGTIPGTVDLGVKSLDLSNMPDIPITDLSVDITGEPGGVVFFATSCLPVPLSGTFTGQGGQAHTSSGQVNPSGCTGFVDVGAPAQ